MMDGEKIKKAVSSIIEAIGEDAEREGLVDTPRRVAQMYEEFFSGLTQDPAKVLETGFEEGHQEMVILRDIPFFSICEHHFLPFYGIAHIGYMPNGRVVGASKLARALDILSRRPQIQERLTDQIVETIYKAIQPEGVAAVISAEHMCMSIRGVKKSGSKVVTSASRGTFKTQAASKQEFFSLLRGT
ncbi:MAG: GTP cyclohydrolase I FolE [Chloroflexi bacterium]|nr:GTP cyclohydrolase I FolE [Chloroflexota bacterium]